MPPLEWAPAGISFRSSEEMSDLFHHRSHEDWTVASLPTPGKLQTLTSRLDIKRRGRIETQMVLKRSICMLKVCYCWAVFVDKNAKQIKRGPGIYDVEQPEKAQNAKRLNVITETRKTANHLRVELNRLDTVSD